MAAAAWELPLSWNVLDLIFYRFKRDDSVFIFSKDGDIKEYHHLTANASKIGIDVEPGIYHSFAATVEDAVLFEVKQGPYPEMSDKDFAPWAPLEGSAEARDYLKGLYGNG